jgi:DNA-binding NarL/FixJ family response regulator
MSSRRRLLLVDDNPTFLRHAQRFLNQLDDLDIVDTTTNPDDVVDLVLRHQPDVCIVDISMPGMSGLDLIPRLRDAMETLRVVILTSHDEEPFRHAARNAGADAYVVKNRLTDDLPGAIRGTHAGLP